MADKIRVLHFIPGFLFGGIESLYLSWYSHLDREKVEFELLLRTQDDNAEALKQYREMDGVYHRLAKMSPKSIFSYIRSVRDFFKAHHDYDILHAHGTDPFVFHYARQFGIRHIILHAHTTDYSKTEKFPIIKRALHRIAMPFVTDRFACSRIAGAWLFGEKLLAQNRVTIIHNAIDVEKFTFNSQVREEVRKSLGLKDSFVVGHVGRMTYQKNYPFLLEVFDELAKLKDNAILLLVGDGPERPEIERHIRELGLNDKVKLLGVRKDVPSLMQAMDVFLLPSHYEGLPVVVVEAQAAGLPCVISDVITEETDLTPLVSRLPLKTPMNKWASCVIQKQASDRSIDFQAFETHGYLLPAVVRQLQTQYESILEGYSYD